MKADDVLLLIDSEAVEGALIRSYASEEDICELVSVFWIEMFTLVVCLLMRSGPSRGKRAIGAGND